MAARTHHFIINRQTGKVRAQGQDTGKLTIVSRHGDIVVIHEEGSTHWVGLGMDRSYDPATYTTYKVEYEVLTNSILMKGELLAQVPVQMNADERKNQNDTIVERF